MADILNGTFTFSITADDYNAKSLGDKNAYIIAALTNTKSQLYSSLTGVIDGLGLTGSFTFGSQYVDDGKLSFSCSCFHSGSYLGRAIWRFKASDGSLGAIWRGKMSLNLFSSYQIQPPEPGGDVGSGSGGFTPPTPTSPNGKPNSDGSSDFPMFDEAVKNGEVLDLDSMTEEQFNFLKDRAQRGEIGLMGGLMDYQKERYLKAVADTWDGSGINVAYDENKSAVVDFYNENGLDTSLNYSFDYNDLGLGYKSDTVYKGIYSDFKMDLHGGIKVSSDTKSKFLDPNLGNLIVSSNSTSATGSITGGLPSVNVGVPAVIALLASGQLDNLSEKTVDLGIKGFQSAAGYASKLYSDFSTSSTGNRVKELFNMEIRDQAYKKGIKNVMMGESAMSNGKVTFDTSTIDFPTIKFDENWTFPTVTFPSIPDIGVLVPDIPNIGIDVDGIPNIGIDAPSIPNIKVDVPSIPNIGVNAPTIPDVDVNFPSPPTIPVEFPVPPVIPVKFPDVMPDIDLAIGDKVLPIDTTGAKVGVEVGDATIPTDPIENPWLELIGLLVTYFTHKNSMSLDEKKKMADVLEKHQLEYKTDNAIRVLEGNVANWKVKDFESVVHEGINNEPVDKIGRSLRAWQGMHSLNPDTSYTGESDTAGNQLNIPKGLIGALLGSGIVEFLREGAMSKALLNVKAQAQADQIEKKSNDTDNNDDNDDDINNIVKGLKKVVYPSDSDYVSQGEGFGSGLKDLQVHSSKMEVK